MAFNFNTHRAIVLVDFDKDGGETGLLDRGQGHDLVEIDEGSKYLLASIPSSVFDINVLTIKEQNALIIKLLAMYDERVLDAGGRTRSLTIDEIKEATATKVYVQRMN